MTALNVAIINDSFKLDYVTDSDKFNRLVCKMNVLINTSYLTRLHVSIVVHIIYLKNVSEKPVLCQKPLFK